MLLHKYLDLIRELCVNRHEQLLIARNISSAYNRVIIKTKLIIMLTKNARELNIISGRDPLPTVEIHADSVEKQGASFGGIVSTTLAKFAAQNPSITATVYSYGTMSINFHEAAWSEFLFAAGNAKVLKALSAAFESYPKIQSRYSDYIAPIQGRASYHIEGGRLWEVEDAFTWYSADGSGDESASNPEDDEGDDDAFVEASLTDGDSEDDEIEDDDIDDDLEDEDEDEDDEDTDVNDATASSAPVKRKGRLNVARADAKVSTIRAEIEKVFGLPEGSVVLCGPDKRGLKGNARIRTLRRRWEENS